MAYDDEDTSLEDTSNEDVAEAAGLIYVHDDDPGLTRVKAGTGFDYIDAKGRPVTNPRTLDRIRDLVIPPAYADVWICRSPRGHIQATGRDERGRKQYRYHALWSAARAQTKFARMAAFGRILPALRDKVDHDLNKRGLPREKVVATVVRLLETTMIRVGNDQYAKANKSFGLTTLRARHLHLHGSEVAFEFKGKSGVQHKTSVHDRRLARVIKSIQELPGQRLFQYVDSDGQRHAVESDDVNAYLRDATGEHFTAKDFRTWAGTLAAAKALSMHPAPETAAEAKKTVTLCVKATAGLLGNTPAVCRSAYIHPEVLRAFVDQRLPQAFAEVDGEDFEQAVLKWLDALAEEVEAETGQSRAAQIRASKP
jgi:DNA topoisomerase-1